MRFSIVKDPDISATDLNHDIAVINKWAHQWKLEFNPDPLQQATEVLFSCKNNVQTHPQIIFNGTVVTKVEEQKHLGLLLESNLSFQKHRSEKIRKAKKNILVQLNTFPVFYPLKCLIKCTKLLFVPILNIVT